MNGRLPVREHLRPRPRALAVPIALKMQLLPNGERDPHGWRWAPVNGMPAELAEMILVAGEA